MTKEGVTSSEIEDEKPRLITVGLTTPCGVDSDVPGDNVMA
jgi:hypothetical protein